jgi:hypothetical protein
VLRTGIITIYLVLRKVVVSGFLDVYPGQAVPAHLQSLVSGYATYRALTATWLCLPLAVLPTSPVLLGSKGSTNEAAHYSF